jgi:hypothetical protein
MTDDTKDKHAALSSSSTQPTIEVEDTIVCEPVGR